MRPRDFAVIAAILLLGALYGYVGHADQQSAEREKTFRNMHA